MHKLPVTARDGVINSYYYRNFTLQIPENPLDLDAASRMALDFADDFVSEDALTFENRLYENNIDDPENVECWVARSGVNDVEYVIAVNMVYGYVEQFAIEPLPKDEWFDDYYTTGEGVEIPNMFAVGMGDTHRFMVFGYNWTATGKNGDSVSGIADSMAPWQSVYHPVNTLTVSGETNFDIECAAPFEDIASYIIYTADGDVYDNGTQWRVLSRITRITQNPNGTYTIFTPSEPGVYYYEIVTKFAENNLTVNYAVKIVVEAASAVETSFTLFTNFEVADARAVVDKYFDAINSGKKADHDAVWTPQRRTMRGDDAPAVILSDIEISYDPNDPMRENYIKYGNGSVNGAMLENVIVFRANFTVTPTNGTDAGAWNIGRYEKWGVILIRDSADVEWYVDDNGY
jgi:hypothetical protein